MNAFVKGLFGGMLVWMLRRYRELCVDMVKVEAALLYLKAVRAARMAFIGLLLLAFSVALAAVGFVLIHIGLFFLLPHPYNAVVLMVLGLLYLILVLLALRWLCSEKTWMKLTKAGDITQSVLRNMQD